MVCGHSASWPEMWMRKGVLSPSAPLPPSIPPYLSSISSFFPFLPPFAFLSSYLPSSLSSSLHLYFSFPTSYTFHPTSNKLLSPLPSLRSLFLSNSLPFFLPLSLISHSYLFLPSCLPPSTYYLLLLPYFPSILPLSLSSPNLPFCISKVFHSYLLLPSCLPASFKLLSLFPLSTLSSSSSLSLCILLPPFVCSSLHFSLYLHPPSSPTLPNYLLTFLFPSLSLLFLIPFFDTYFSSSSLSLPFFFLHLPFLPGILYILPRYFLYLQFSLPLHSLYIKSVY